MFSKRPASNDRKAQIAPVVLPNHIWYPHVYPLAEYLSPFYRWGCWDVVLKSLAQDDTGARSESGFRADSTACAPKWKATSVIWTFSHALPHRDPGRPRSLSPFYISGNWGSGRLSSPGGSPGWKVHLRRAGLCSSPPSPAHPPQRAVGSLSQDSIAAATRAPSG